MNAGDSKLSQMIGRTVIVRRNTSQDADVMVGRLEWVSGDGMNLRLARPTTGGERFVGFIIGKGGTVDFA